MAPNRITRSSSLLETLRLLALRRNNTSAATGNHALPPPERHDAQALQRQLRELALAMDLTDPHAILKIREHALREILLWEFGEGFRTDPQFLPMVEAIGKTLDGNARYQEQFMRMMQELRDA